MTSGSLSKSVGKKLFQFSSRKMILPRIRRMYKYGIVITLVLVFVGLLMQFRAEGTITANGVMMSAIRGERSRLSAIRGERSRLSPRTTTLTPTGTTQADARLNGPVFVNPHPFRYLLNPETFCARKDIFIITYVHSTPDRFEKRAVIRQTWGKWKYLNKTILVVFIMGQVADIGVMASLRIESGIHGDIVQEDFVDSYYNLTYKAIAGLKWVSTFCRQAVYVLKTDDDIFVNFYVLMRYILSNFGLPYESTRQILCNQYVNASVKRDKLSKWYMAKEDFLSDHYLAYCSGSAYLMIADVTQRLYEVSLNTPFFWIDDYYVTGLLAHKLNVARQKYNRAYVLKPTAWVISKALKSGKYHDFVFFHLPNTAMMYSLWDTVLAMESNATRVKNIANINSDIQNIFKNSTDVLEQVQFRII
ncbi:beta-1,3-galactosyltransferase 1-like [Gigantopelta aegis]|uniref:beta-1,3-galactosyltransferase 1-like n=1 Tax=Gigantopelta aegis TaxID=1735272 RepID=UPI001B88976D|nr:beta-1,3-galactosyltransferase 1-like [Gigantopelta aegis]